MLTPKAREQFKILCQTSIPEYILRKVDDDNLIGQIVSIGQNRDLFVGLYKYDDEYVNFVFGRLHYEIDQLFTEYTTRIAKGNRYLLAGDRVTISHLSRILQEFNFFFGKNGCIFHVNPTYLESIEYLANFTKSDNTKTYVLPDEYSCPLRIYEPIFDLTHHSHFSNVKHLIFGVSTQKPDIRIKDVMDGNIEVVNTDDVLVFDNEIDSSLTFKDMDLWWSKNKGKYKWYKRKEHLQPNEMRVQDFYKANFFAENNPVLIPQVYLHYDPKSRNERRHCAISDTLIFQRMDFLILYNNRRIIIEIDGESHFVTNNHIDLEKYARQLEYDRTMRFLGYDVFRISNSDLTDDKYEKVLFDFFTNLYYYLGINS